MFSVDAVVFDLDGTLWDTCRACAVAWNNVLRRRGIAFRSITADDVRGVAGRPHEECIRAVFAGLREDHLRVLSEDTKEEDNRMVAELGGELYEGVAVGLELLSARFPLFIVSNCQAGYVETFFGSTALGRFFRDHECWGRTGKTKPENLQALVARNGMRAPILVGDTAGDLAAARASGIPFVHAAYGFGDPGDFDAQIARFGELPDLIRPL